MKNKLIIFFVTATLIACSGKKETPNQNALTIYQEAMKIHDEIMPRMDEMYKLEGKLKAKRDSLLVDSIANTQRLAIVQEKLFALEAANKDMMDWMHNIKDVPGASATSGHEHHSDHGETNQPKETNPEEALKVQKEQKQRIEEVKVAMEKSIEDANQLLNID